MIDKSKNVCYIIDVNFFYRKNDGAEGIITKRFVSHHSITTKRFRQFAEKELRERYAFVGFLEDWGSQYTVPNVDFCR